MRSYEELLEVFNEDLEYMDMLELEEARVRTVAIVAADPAKFVWRHPDFITARMWGAERLAIISELLQEMGRRCA